MAKYIPYSFQDIGNIEKFFLDLSDSSTNLGGILTYRRICEVVTEYNNNLSITLLLNRNCLRKFNFFLTKKIFNASFFRVNFYDILSKDKLMSDMYSQEKQVPYYSTQPLVNICKLTGLPLQLKWSKVVKEKVLQISRAIGGRIICVHVKNQQAGNFKLSNADVSIWEKAIRKVLHRGISVVALGHDIPRELRAVNHSKMFVLADINDDIVVHLAFPQICDGFVGMASGISSAAIYSSIPYVIYKHPRHDASDMSKELVNGKIPLSFDNQKIIQKMPVVKEIVNSCASMVKNSTK